MSVTVSDILSLPCLAGAKVVAGAGGLSKVLTSITVLEYADPTPLQDELFQKVEFYGSEIVISAFASIADSVSQQCDNIRRLASAGEVGLILYYVGVILPEVAPELISLADELDFTLIVMPEGRMDLRYSEVICDVMEVIFRDQSNSVSLTEDILTQMVQLKEHQRTADTVLRMVRDHIRASLVLVNHTNTVIGQAAWPTSQEPELPPLHLPPMEMHSLPNGRIICRCPLEQDYELYIIKDGTPISKETVLQAADIVQLAVNLWGGQQSESQMTELVRAILRDEPIKMRRLAELIHIDVASIHSMWLLRCSDISCNASSLSILKEVLEHICRIVVAGCYENCVVAFMEWPEHRIDLIRLAKDILDRLSAQGVSATITRCHQLPDTAAVRKAFLAYREHLGDAVRIWPKKQIYTLENLAYTALCRREIEYGEEELQEALRPMEILSHAKEGNSLVKTLTVYLLDADGRVTCCSELLHVHKNTVKYRLERISEILEMNLGSQPERFFLYRAAVLYRLFGQSG